MDTRLFFRQRIDGHNLAAELLPHAALVQPPPPDVGEDKEIRPWCRDVTGIDHDHPTPAQQVQLHRGD
jgi:hypothetical protein